MQRHEKKLKQKNDKKIDHKDPERSVCPLCGKSYIEYSKLKKHILIIHEGRKDFKCDDCGKCFGRSDQLDKHKKAVHEGERNHECEQCRKTFFAKGDMQRHIDSVHLKKPDVWKRKKKLEIDEEVSNYC